MSEEGSRRLKLTRRTVKNVDFLYLSAFRMRVDVTDHVNMDPRVFVYRRDLPNPYTGQILDTFFSIASPVDMEEYPAEEPDPEKAYPFFRKTYVELDFRATADAEAAWELIVREAYTLVHALNRLTVLQVDQEVWIGPFPEDPDHGSASVPDEIP